MLKIEAVQAHESDQSDQSDEEGSKGDRTISQTAGSAQTDNPSKTTASLYTVGDLVKVGTDGVEDMDIIESGEYSDEDILPDI